MKTVLRTLIGIYLAYLAISVLVIMPALNFLPGWFMEREYQRELRTELVIFNPLSLALEVREAALQEPDGGDFAGFDRLAVNLSVSSLWRRGVVLDELALQGLTAHLKRFATGDLNIQDFIPPPTEEAVEPQPAEAAPLPAISIQDLHLSAHRIAVSDFTRASPYSTEWEDLGISVAGLSTVIEDGEPYHLQLQDEAGGHLEWTGELSLPESRSSGMIEITGLALRPGWRYVRDEVNFEVASARLDFTANYQANWSGEPRFSIDGGLLRLRDIAVAPAEGLALADTGIELGEVTLDGIAVDTATEQVQAGSLSVDGLVLRGWSEGARVSLAEMFETRFPAAADNDGEDETSPWRVSLGQAAVNAARITWRSEFTDPAQLSVSPLNIQVTDIQWPATGPSQMQLDLQVNEALTTRVQGDLHLGEGDGQFEIDLAGLPLPWFAPNVPEVLNARIDSGTAGTRASVSLLDFAPQTASLSGAVENFAVRLYEADESLTSWKSLSWQDLVVDLAGQSVNLKQLHLDTFSGRVHILEDGSLNIQRLLREEAQAQAEAGTVTDEEPAGELAEAEAEPSSPWTFRVPTIHITDSEVDFLDEALPIHFRTMIGDVNGDILGLDSDPAKSLEVDITGSVDGYAPVVLKGSASPLREQPALDLLLTFQGVDLARLTPYSATYAGYAIDQGTMNLDLEYQLEENRLQGDNKLVIRQLKLGEQIASDDALDLPLKLGIALLTDANGVIDLAVPVTGDVNNPSFSLGSVIAGAFVNLLTKAVTAPFNLLANLVGSNEDLERVNFPAGSRDTDDTGRAKLQQLAQALLQRPNLELVIHGRLHPDTDPAKLQAALLREELLASGLNPEDIDNRSDAWAEAIAERYTGLAAKGADEAGAEPPSPVIQARRVREQIAVPPDMLKTLAEDRAAAAKRFLVNEGGIAADRAVVAQADPGDEAHSFSGVEMSLDY